MRRLTHGTERRGRGPLRATALLTLLTALLAVPTTAGAAPSGGLKQLVGSSGCLSGEASPPSGCGAVRGLGTDIGEAVMTPDGTQVYVASRDKGAIVLFDRNATTGTLTQKSSILGCFTASATIQASDGCSRVTTDTTALDQVDALAVSAGGTSLYATTLTGHLTTLKRAGDGTLTFVDTRDLGFGGSVPQSFPGLTVAPDGKTVYLAGPGSFNGIMWIYARDTSGGATHGNLSLIDCIAVTACSRQVPNMQLPSDIGVTPDNKQLILAGGESCCNHAVIGFDRNVSATGTFGDLDATQANTASRCVTGNAGLANCTARSGQDYPRGLSIANNRDIYVRGYYSLSAVQRNAATNALAPQPSSSFCASYTGSGYSNCVESKDCTAFCGGRGVFATPDGRFVYTGGEGSGSMLAFNRNAANGAFSLNTSPLGCLTTPAVTDCGRIRQGSTVRSVIGDPGNKFVYSAGGGRVFSFAIDHPPVCSNVSASTLNTAAVSVALSCSDPDGDALTYEKITDPSRGTLAGISGNHVSYGPQPGTTGADSFQYLARGAGVASDPATATVNVSAPPTGGGGGGGGTPPPLTVLGSSVSTHFLAFRKYTKVDKLTINDLPAGTRVRVQCKTKKKKQQKKGCPYKSRTVATTFARAKLNVLKPFKKKKMPAKTKITITITATGFIGKQFTYTMRSPKSPRPPRRLCIPPGGKPARCA